MNLFTEKEKLVMAVSIMTFLYFNEKDKRKRRDRKIRKILQKDRSVK